MMDFTFSHKGLAAMRPDYNRIAGQSIERLAALSDGIFAVAMTLLVLDLHAPAIAAIRGEADLLHALWGLAPRLVIYLMSFLTLGIFWVGQQTQLNHLSHTDCDLTWIHLAFLFAATLMPFSTGLMAEFIRYRAALLLYWANILLFGLLLLASWRYASREALIRHDAAEGVAHSIECRIVVAQALYGLGALLSIVSTCWSIGFIILVQLNYATAPRIGPLRRL
jgi:uncharacterized membrane protein